MSSRGKCVTEVVVTLATVLAARAFSAESPASQRLPGQEHNRMVCVKTEGKEYVYVNMPRHYDLGSPSLSPDGKMIAFDALTVGEEPNRESWVVGVDGKGLRKLGDVAVPRWSPDGKRLLVTRYADADGAAVRSQSLHEFDLATGKDRLLCEGRFGDWSPDGRQIAFARGGSRTANAGIYWQSKIYVAKADGSDPQELGDGDWPSWSPDGKKIACHIKEEGQMPFLWIVDAATKKRTVLGVGFYRAQWAGDGKSVVCNGLLLAEEGRPQRVPARFWLDKSRLEFFFMDRDTPFSPCVSRDGTTMALIVDSEGGKKPSRGTAPEE